MHDTALTRSTPQNTKDMLRMGRAGFHTNWISRNAGDLMIKYTMRDYVLIVFIALSCMQTGYLLNSYVQYRTGSIPVVTMADLAEMSKPHD